MDKNVIVTGGAGYIGSHVCKKLYQDGYNPISIDNLSRGNKTLVKWGPLYVQDIRDYQKIKKIINEHMPIGVIHLAAFAYVDESIRRPLMYYDNNIQGGFSLIRAMIDCDVKKMVYSSSCSVYGIPENVPISEDCKLGPINPYGKTKLIFEIVPFCWHTFLMLAIYSILTLFKIFLFQYLKGNYRNHHTKKNVLIDHG